MKKLILPLVAVLALLAFASAAEARCGKARQRAGSVLRAVLPPYGR